MQTPAQLLKNLSFDEVNMVDTTLAKEYVNKCDIETKFKKSNSYAIEIKSAGTEDYRKIFKSIAQKIRENAVLFAQLEYLVREFWPEDVLKYDVPMIAQHFEYMSAPHRKRHESPWPVKINFTALTPLAILGFQADRDSVFVTTRNTVAVALLFSSICQEAGLLTEEVPLDELPVLNNLETVYINSRIACVDGSITAETTSGSVVVVTGKCDVDSAAESARNALQDHRYPWRVRRVIVQESVYEHFRNRLSNKPFGEFERIGFGSFAYDFAGSERDTPLILVEAYRTTKELLSLLEKYKPHYLSLWCNDISTSNEIAIKASALTIWINDFGIPSERNMPLFYTGLDNMRSGMLELRYHFQKWSDSAKQVSADIERLVKIRAEWVKNTVEQRKAAVLKVIELQEKSEKSDAPYWSAIKRVIELWEPTSFYNVNHGLVSCGFQIPYGAHFKATCLTIPEVCNFLESIIIGNGILFEVINQLNRADFLTLGQTLVEFEKSGVPFVKCQGASELVSKQIDFVNWTGESFPLRDDNVVLKTITSSFGETFAN